MSDIIRVFVSKDIFIIIIQEVYLFIYYKEKEESPKDLIPYNILIKVGLVTVYKDITDKSCESGCSHSVVEKDIQLSA